MKVIVTTTFVATSRGLWKEIVNPVILQKISAPMLTFTPKAGTDFSKPWNTSDSYDVSLHLGGILPLGSHSIRIRELNREKNLIRSEESGHLAKVWNHTIYFSERDGKLEYTDEVEIRAGILTFPIWLFANLFYRHRQRNWKTLMSSCWLKPVAWFCILKVE